ncbi:MAG: MBL fold metallo-hydrolase [Defluviitaleaceae bacterium]|nr:MBL fold metallo-hydrolase [Defluviitaleaceae bacterium]
MKNVENAALLPISGMGTVYLVLLWDEKNLVLIDAGYPGQTEDIVKAIETEGFDAKNLTHIIITHQDWDHIGCITDLQKLAPNLQVLAHEDEAPYIDGRITPIKLAARFANYDNLDPEMQERVDGQKEHYEKNKITINKTLHDGEILPLCGGIEVIHTPGHTPGHIVLLHKDSGIIICGDACNIKWGQMVELKGPNPVHTHEMEQATASFEKIKSRNPKGIVAYHGGYLKMDGAK